MTAKKWQKENRLKMWLLSQRKCFDIFSDPFASSHFFLVKTEKRKFLDKRNLLDLTKNWNGQGQAIVRRRSLLPLGRAPLISDDKLKCDRKRRKHGRKAHIWTLVCELKWQKLSSVKQIVHQESPRSPRNNILRNGHRRRQVYMTTKLFILCLWYRIIHSFQ